MTSLILILLGAILVYLAITGKAGNLFSSVFGSN